MGQEYLRVATELRDLASVAPEWTREQQREITDLKRVASNDDESKEVLKKCHQYRLRSANALAQARQAVQKVQNAEALLLQRCKDAITQHFSHLSDTIFQSETEMLIVGDLEGRSSDDQEQGLQAEAGVETNKESSSAGREKRENIPTLLKRLYLESAEEEVMKKKKLAEIERRKKEILAFREDLLFFFA